MRRCTRAAGQALAEFCVCLLGLLPLMLAVPLLGKYLDLVYASDLASRYVAFEAIAHDPLNGRLHDDELSLDVARRFFNRSDASIRTGEPPGSSPQERNGLWVDHRMQPFLDDPGRQVSVTTRAATRDPFPAARAWWHDGFDLRSRNLITGALSVSPAMLPALQRQTGLLVDDWTALNTRDVQLRIEHAGTAIYPTEQLHTLLEFAGQFPRLLTDQPVEPGLPDWEIVPCDRLAGGCAP
ncbi:MAG: hypothetical protein JSS24_00345 [Proteobacteria bacterium]|nr:hypothetical protein [Pseudomonadota bacterium]